MRFEPDRVFRSVTELTPALLEAQKLRGLILDIDNTLAPRDIPLPDDRLVRWAGTLKDAGVRLYIISNNRSARVKRFSEALGIPYIPIGLKPLPFSFLRAVRRMKLPKESVAAVGDQVYTDIAGAHLAGLRAFLVAPINLKSESASVRFRRRFEQPVLRRYDSRHEGESEE